MPPPPGSTGYNLEYFKRHASGPIPFCIQISRLKKGQCFARDDHGCHIAPQDCCVAVSSKTVLATDSGAGFLGNLTLLKSPDLKQNEEDQ